MAVDQMIATVNGKGGVGKTSVSAQLAGLAALSDWRVLLIDLDPQGDLTRNLGYRDRSDDGHALFEAFRSASRPEPLRDVRPNLDVLCGGTRLGRIEDGVTLRNAQANKFAPAQGGDKGDDLVAPLSDIAEDYDLVVCDCPPNVNSGLTIEALRIARFALIPTMDDDASIDGLERLAKTVAAVRSAEDGNPDLEVLGVVLFNLGGTLPAIQRETRQTLHRLLGDAVPVFDSTIRTARRAAHDMRQRGLLAHEYEDEVDNAPTFHDARRQGLQPPRLAANADGLAADYANLANEALGRFADLLAADEDTADQPAEV